MRVAVVILPFIAIAVVLPALAGEQALPTQPAEGPSEASPKKKPMTWEEWISTHAYDPIVRRWVPIPEGVEPGPKSGYIWNLGRWEIVKIVHRKGHGWGYFDHRGRWHGRDERRTVFRKVLWRRSHYRHTIPRKSFEEPYLVRAIKLEPTERERLEDLLQRNLIQELMLGDPSEAESVVSFEQRKSRVSISGRAELVAKLATLITDESTYKAYTTAKSHGNIVEVISIVDLGWLDRDPERALNIADLNFAGLLRLVRARSDEHRRLGKALWFNELYGTITIIDQPDTIRKIRQYLAVMPYAPKPTRMTITPDG